MFTETEATAFLICLEGFLYGIYSGIFAIYLHCASRESRTAAIVFYALCILYVLSAATVVSDLLSYTIGMRLSTLSLQQVDSQSTLFRLSIVQTTINGCCDFIAQCTLIYRCWIVWDKNIRVIIVPSFLAITYIVTWQASSGAYIFDQGISLTAIWGNTLVPTGLVASMVVNALVTGLIVFKILKVFLEVKPTSELVERTLSSLPVPVSSTGGPKFRHIISIIIESGMALFAIQLVRVVISSLMELQGGPTPLEHALATSLEVVVSIHQMLNGIAPTLILVRTSMRSSFDDEESRSFNEALQLDNLPSDPNSLQRVGSSSSMPLQESLKIEDICFDNPPSDSNIILQVRRVSVGSSGSSTPPQERSEDTIEIMV